MTSESISRTPNFPTLIDTDEPLRIPISLVEWTSFNPLSLTSEPTTSHLHENEYAPVIGRRTLDEAMTILVELMCRYPADFTTASRAIKPQAWRWFYYRSNFLLDAIASKFHAGQALRSLCEQRDSSEEAPAEWTGIVDTEREIYEEACLAIRYLSPRQAQAAWCILATAQRLDLRKSEVLRCTWHDPRYLQQLALYCALAR